MVLSEFELLQKAIDNCYENKNYNKVYSCFWDFMKYTLQDFFLQIVKYQMICDYEDKITEYNK